jgi:hypothetical protein
VPAGKEEDEPMLTHGIVHNLVYGFLSKFL